MIQYKYNEKEDNMNIECNNCKDLKDQFGNFVFYPFLKRFVDWEYWNGTCPKDCPKLNK